MTLITRLSDITDDIQDIIFDFGFLESLEGFKFSKNVYSIYINSHMDLSTIDFPEQLKKLYISTHCCDFINIKIPKGLYSLEIRIFDFNALIINLIFPPNLIELTLYGCIINNLIFPKSLQTLRSDAEDLLDYDFNHELNIITFFNIDNPKFELVKAHDFYHYIYLKWPRSHFIKEARI